MEIDKRKFDMIPIDKQGIMAVIDDYTLNWENYADENANGILYEGTMVALMNCSTLHGGGSYLINQFEVASSYRRMGFGTKFVELFTMFPMEFYVRPFTEQAKKFWNKANFNEISDGKGGTIWHYKK
jgi:GNAT superfamily N-acetyltransferase